MGLSRLSSRAVIGEFYRRLAIETGAPWIPKITSYFDSDQDSETYPFIGQVPQLREWIGGRQSKGFTDNGIEIKNRHFEATIYVPVKWMRRDKTGQVMARIGELAQSTAAHWAELSTLLIVNGASTVCYDGQFFYDTDHLEGASGAQSNKIDVDISALPAEVHGSATAPSVEEMQLAIVKSIQQILLFKDDQGRPSNSSARNFVVMTPVSLWQPAANAVSLRGDARQFPSQTGLDAMRDAGITIEVAANPYLDASSWTDKFATFRTDSSTKAIIRQQETEVDLKVIAEGSELEFKEDKHEYGADTWRNVGYGEWRDSVQSTLI